MNNSKKISGAEILLRSLMEEGVDTIFGYPGGAIVPVYDQMYHYKDRLNHILVRHEQGAVHAAQGYARASQGKVGVCFATSGPGATNLVTGIADAMVDSTPIVCITAQVGAAEFGSVAFKEADVISMTMPITKWNYQVTCAQEICSAVAKAFYIAQSGRPGPVVIDISKNAQVEMIESFNYEKCSSLRSYNPSPLFTTSQLEKAVAMINDAKQPLILVGQGVKIAAAEKVVMALAEKISAPMASTLMGLSAIPTAHPLYIGKLGMHGNTAPNLLTQKSDLIIALGMRFSDRVTGDIKHYAPNAKIIHIDIDPVEIGKVVPVALGIVSDVKVVVEALTPSLQPKKNDEWLRFAKECYDYEFAKVIKEVTQPSDGQITMGEVVRIIAEQSQEDALIVTDVGQQQMFSSRYSKFTRTRSFITSGGLGTMGFGLPASIGAKMAVPDRQVVAILGDGGFQMTMQELGTIMQSKIPVKVVVLNNSFLGMVRQWQELFYDKRYSFTEMVNPEFTTIASAYGIKNQKVTDRSTLTKAVEEMLACQSSYFLEVIVRKEDNVFPMVPLGSSISNLLYGKEQK